MSSHWINNLVFPYSLNIQYQPQLSAAMKQKEQILSVAVDILTNPSIAIPMIMKNRGNPPCITAILSGEAKLILIKF